MAKPETTRTSVELPRKLLARSKARAFDERRDLKDLIAEALTRYLANEPRRRVADKPGRPAKPVRKRKPATKPAGLDVLRSAMDGL